MSIVRKEWRQSLLYRPLRHFKYYIWQKYKKELLADRRERIQLMHDIGSLTQDMKRQNDKLQLLLDSVERCEADQPRFTARVELEYLLEKKLPKPLMDEFRRAFRSYDMARLPSITATEAEEARKRADWLMKKAQKKAGLHFDTKDL